MKPALLFYCQHSVGLGHLARSFALVRSLVRDFDVTLLCGGQLPDGIPVPPGVEILGLPSLAAGDGGDAQWAARQTERRDLLLATYARTRPAAVLIELFPFGRKKFTNELLPLLKLARRRAAPPLVVCSLRDILVSGRRGQAHHDDRAAWLCNRYFDRVLIHADPRLARLEDSFSPPRQRLRTPVEYTGYVAPPNGAARAAPRQRHLLVSAGGGLVGMPLFARVLQAHRLLDAATRRPLRIVAGPFLPDSEFAELRQMAGATHDVELLRVVPDLAAEMRVAAGSVSQCGYNTAMDIAASAVPALVVPYVTATETEQTQRAARLQELGILQWLDLRDVSDEVLATRLQQLPEQRTLPASLDLNGADATRAALRAAILQRTGGRHARVA